MTKPAARSKVQIGLDYIARHPDCRSEALAAAIGCAPREVHAYLRGPLDRGWVLTCVVSRAGQTPTAQWRIAAAMPGSPGAAWREFTLGNARSLRAARQQATQAGSGANNPGSQPCGVSFGISSPPQGPAGVEPPARVKSPAPARSIEKRFGVFVCHSTHANQAAADLVVQKMLADGFAHVRAIRLPKPVEGAR